MSDPTHPQTFGGLPVVVYSRDSVGQTDRRRADRRRPDRRRPSTSAWRLEVEYADGPDEFAELFASFLGEVGGAAVTALLIGQWGRAAYEHSAPVALLAASAAELPNLRALFLGDMVSEECQISWIRIGHRLPAHHRRLVIPGGEVPHVGDHISGPGDRLLGRRDERPLNRQPPQLRRMTQEHPARWRLTDPRHDRQNPTRHRRVAPVGHPSGGHPNRQTDTTENPASGG